MKIPSQLLAGIIACFASLPVFATEVNDTVAVVPNLVRVIVHMNASQDPSPGLFSVMYEDNGEYRLVNLSKLGIGRIAGDIDKVRFMKAEPGERGSIKLVLIQKNTLLPDSYEARVYLADPATIDAGAWKSGKASGQNTTLR